jgi:RNA polymerase sigma factor (sigma-70 family)
MAIFQGKPDLLRRFRAGERSALAEVYDVYAERVGRLVRLGCQLHRQGGGGGSLFVNPQDFLDVTHEVFLKAFSPAARAGYDGVRPFEPYLLMIARNTMIDWFRRRGATVSLSADLLARLPGGDPEPDDRPPWEHPDTVAALEQYLAELPPELAAVHRHRYQAGRSQEETAAAMGLTRQSLRTLEERLKRGLARALEAPPRPASRTARGG